ncbi:hypothetical protein KEM60_02193 [Austwickia sp. TVS 96-490-7B]|uniref:hypothetical protein n=1 Tax=Austwickia sp. TVS 96-490-7B TaxID=2830843 RepID=UPI001C584E92|nr:hypothetical protein [Austwickia sp. TVS 96-490-7B]MBW3085982.1 hypothetical protein [Austwickia sp. TVS 96-490-7B]
MVEWDEITTAVGLALSGDKVAGKAALQRAWASTHDGDHAQRCVLAHYMADLEDNLADEVRWDELALEHYPHIQPGELCAIGIADVRGLASSLHLNLGDGYVRQGRVEDARLQLAAGQAGQVALSDDGYGDLIRKGLQGLEQRIAQSR